MIISKEKRHKPFFSIIMPCYNSEKYIDTAIRSIREQTYDNWELIAINDGSTDQTFKIIMKYADQDHRIIVFSKDNGGYCSAVNLGLNNVSGNYFLIMGSDDTLSKDALESIYKESITCDTLPDLIGFRTISFLNETPIGVDEYTVFESVNYDDNTNIKKYQIDYPLYAKIFSIRDTSKCYKTSLLSDLRYFGKYGFDADGIFAMLFAYRCHSFLNVPNAVYCWQKRPDSLSGRKLSIDVYEDRLYNWMLFYQYIQNMEFDRLTNQTMEYLDYYYNLVWKYAEMITDINENKFKILKKHSRFVFYLARKYKITFGNSFLEKFENYFYLLFPKLSKNHFKERSNYCNGK